MFCIAKAVLGFKYLLLELELEMLAVEEVVLSIE
jgi:hypothetical protein